MESEQALQKHTLFYEKSGVENTSFYEKSGVNLKKSMVKINGCNFENFLSKKLKKKVDSQIKKIS